MFMNIDFSQIQSSIGNFCFLISFFITIYYWLKIIFFSEQKSSSYGFYGFFTINILLTIQLISRWIDSGHFPLSSLYESLLFLCWAIIFIYLILENFVNNEIIGVLVSPLILCILAFTGFSLPVELQATKPLVPALQSNWLFMHVSVMMLSYAGLLIGSLLSVSYLVIYQFLANKYIRDIPQNSLILETPGTPFDQENSLKIQKFLNIFDNLSYRTIGIGFCFLTLGILSGAVWANETWGTYWSWDPKETWALITWLTFAAYLHTRLLYGWQGVKPAGIASLGFLLVWICYLGVNLLGKGLHSYGFFS
jgi:cytochrome c-type biogenesis protein CcsB